MEHRQFRKSIVRTDLHPPTPDQWKLKTNGPKTKSSTQTIHARNMGGKAKKPKVKSTASRKMKFGKNSLPA